MGGPGSGRRRIKTAVEECRVLDLGELLDGPVARAAAHGEVVWRASAESLPGGLFAWTVAGYGRAGLQLLYYYWPSAYGPPEHDRLAICEARGRAAVVRCPGPRCKARAVRRLYDPPGEGLFLCRICHDLVYAGRHRFEPHPLASVVGPLLASLGPNDEQGALWTGLVAADDSLLDLDDPQPQELRLVCLRLRQEGLSVRQIAARTGHSKSAVQRLLAAGSRAIDPWQLLEERDRRSFRLSPELTVRQSLTAISRQIAVQGLDRLPRRKLEVRLVLRATDSGGIEGANSWNDQGPWERLLARGERRLVLERRRWLAQRTRS